MLDVNKNYRFFDINHFYVLTKCPLVDANVLFSKR